jgi:hypothetical protein
MNLHHVIAAGFLLVLNFGCATAEQKWFAKWKAISVGHPRELIVEDLGDPSDFSKDASGRESMAWQANEYTKCTLTLLPNGNAENKSCAVDQAAKAAYQARMDQRAAAWRMASQQMHEDQRQRERAQEQENNNWSRDYLESIERRRPTSTRCTSRNLYGTVQTDCQTQ